MSTPSLIEHTDQRYGPESTNRLAETVRPGPEGARAALESFYYALNHRDGAALRQTLGR